MVVPRTTRLQFLVVRPSFWLSATWSKVNGVEFHSWDMKLMVVRRTTTSVFLVVRRPFWLSRAHGQPKFRTLLTTIIMVDLTLASVRVMGSLA